MNANDEDALINEYYLKMAKVMDDIRLDERLKLFSHKNKAHIQLDVVMTFIKNTFVAYMDAVNNPDYKENEKIKFMFIKNISENIDDAFNEEFKK